MAEAPALVWLRQDLRLADNLALDAAVATKRPVALVYVLDDETPGPWRTGAASRWWLHRSLEALARDIERRKGRLILRRGRADTVVPRLVDEVGASAVFWNRCYEPFAVKRDEVIKRALQAAGVEATSFNGALLHEPWTVKTKSGEPFKVFTPFWRAALQQPVRELARAPNTLNAYLGAAASDALESWRLVPSKPNWAAKFEPHWTPGEAGARATFERFIDDKLRTYAAGRDQLGQDATSRLSPHLHWGEISPVQIKAAIDGAAARDPSFHVDADKFMAELGWREFSYTLLFHWPTLPEQNWREDFDRFPWRTDDAALEAWRRGRTGYPVVDAAMRQLWATGYMHNRARMIAASFLIKHLLIDWRSGEDWFWDTLVDADLANNAASWQWVAGSGADAAPYFRIFNPVAQGQRFDADGAYVRRWLPELARLPDAYIHRPWQADAATLAAAGVALGEDYPRPVIDHAIARARALAAFASLSSGA
jgi:deoxyribodipyrimidine photo-lyase